MTATLIAAAECSAFSSQLTGLLAKLLLVAAGPSAILGSEFHGTHDHDPWVMADLFDDVIACSQYRCLEMDDVFC
jgi:hypothetical protein